MENEKSQQSIVNEIFRMTDEINSLSVTISRLSAELHELRESRAAAIDSLTRHGVDLYYEQLTVY